MQLTARARELVDGCIGGLDRVEKRIEQVQENPAEKLQDRLADALDYVHEVRRRLKALLGDQTSLPDWTEANAIQIVNAEKADPEEPDRIC